MAPVRTRGGGLPRLLVAGFFAAGVSIFATACNAEHGTERVPWALAGAEGDAAPNHEDPTVFEVPPPLWSEPDIFPCSECHNADLPPDPKRRELTVAHDNIVLRHDEEHRWCLDCHDPDERDVLRLANGTKVPFTESYKLCGQCHGDKYRDWRAGVHGRRIGSWDGKKQYLLCVTCHDAHAPKFKPLAPKPPPVRPEEIR